MKIKSTITDFRRGLSILFSKSKAGEGDRKLAKMSKIVMAQIPLYGKQTVRTQVIKSIESDLKRSAKKGGKDAVESKLDNALQTPEYMMLLRKLGLEEPHLRVMAMEALKNGSKLPRYTCLRCGHSWIPRADATPTVCPKCKSPYWNKKWKEVY